MADRTPESDTLHVQGSPAVASQRESELLCLPVEIIVYILDLSDALSIARVQRTCHLAYDIIRSAIRLQYKIQCFLSSVVDNPASTFSLNEKLDRLKEWHRAWKTLRWTHRLSIPLAPDPAAECLLLDGLAFIRRALDSHMLDFHRFPSALRGVAEKEWILREHDFTPSTALYDSAQDVLVLTEPRIHDRLMRLHILSLTTGRPHPLAVKPVIDVPDCALLIEEGVCNLQLVGPKVVLSLATHDDDPISELWIYDWRRGELLMDMFGERHFGDTSETVQLDEQYLLMVLDIDDKQGLVIFDIDKVPNTRIDIANMIGHHYTAILVLPQLSPKVIYNGIWVDGCLVTDPQQTSCNFGAAFLPNSRRSLIVVALEVHDYNEDHDSIGQTWKFDLLIPTDGLFSILRNITGAPDERKIFHWPDWGHNTRMMDLNIEQDFYTYAHGPKYITTVPQPLPPGSEPGITAEQFITLYDFDSIPSMVADAANPAFAEQTRFVTEHMEMPRPWLWCTHSRQVFPRAPYREIRSNIKVGGDDDVLIGDDSIIVIPEAEAGGSRVDVYTF